MKMFRLVREVVWQAAFPSDRTIHAIPVAVNDEVPRTMGGWFTLESEPLSYTARPDANLRVADYSSRRFSRKQ
jgi:hypothetical protein